MINSNKDERVVKKFRKNEKFLLDPPLTAFTRVAAEKCQFFKAFPYS